MLCIAGPVELKVKKMTWDQKQNQQATSIQSLQCIENFPKRLSQGTAKTEMSTLNSSTGHESNFSTLTCFAKI